MLAVLRFRHKLKNPQAGKGICSLALRRRHSHSCFMILTNKPTVTDMTLWGVLKTVRTLTIPDVEDLSAGKRCNILTRCSLFSSQKNLLYPAPFFGCAALMYNTLCLCNKPKECLKNISLPEALSYLNSKTSYIPCTWQPKRGFQCFCHPEIHLKCHPNQFYVNCNCMKGIS